MKNVMKDMTGQPWSLSSSWWGIWGRGIAHGPTGKQFTVVIVTKIKMMSFIVLIKCLNGEQIFSSPSYKAPTLALSIILERKFFLRKMEQIIFIKISNILLRSKLVYNLSKHTFDNDCLLIHFCIKFAFFACTKLMQCK